MINLIFGCIAIVFLVQDCKAPYPRNFKIVGIVSNALWLLGCSMGFLNLFVGLANIIIIVGCLLAIGQFFMAFKM